MSSEKAYGNCRGSESEYITLISSDGHEFVIKREVALVSVTIKAMLTGPGQFEESQTNEINFRAIPSHILKRVCDYLLYKECYTDATCEIPEFQMNPEEALELLMAANFLDI